MEKRGQMTLFIIIAIVIVVAGIAVFSFAPEPSEDLLNVDNIKTFVADCLLSESNSVIPEMAERGGYFLTPKLSTSTGIPIYHEGKNNLIPSKSFVEGEIGEYLSQKMFFCTRGFSDFKNEYEISASEITADVFIEREYIDFELHYPIQIKREESVVNLRDFDLRIETKFGMLYDSVVEFIEVSEGENCLSCILDISVREDIYVDMFDNENNETIFIFRDEDYTVESEEVLRYVFAEK